MAPAARQGARRIAVAVLLASLVLGPTLGPGAAAAAAVRDAATVVTGPVATARQSTPRCGPAPQGQIALVMVIDRGTGTPSTRCAIVDQGSDGLDALRATGHSVRLDGGFVCAIDGLPATGCGNIPGSPYWRYWHASPGGRWTYSQVGAGGYRLPTRCAVEGWVWSDSPSPDTPPRIAAPVPLCEAPPTTAAPTTTARPPAGGGAPPPSPPAATTPPSPGPDGAPSPPGGSGGGSPATTTPRAQVGGVTTSRPPAGDDAEGAAELDPAGGAASEEASAGAATSSGPSEGSSGADGGSDGEMAVGTSDGGSSTPWGVLVGVVLIIGLGVAASLRSRTRALHAEADAT